MNPFVYIHGQLFTFRQFLLSEAIALRQTQFGVNSHMDDGKWLQEGTHLYTFFEYRERSVTFTYMVTMVKNSDGSVELLFGGTTEDGSVDPHDYTLTKSHSISGSLLVFNSVFYIFVKGLEKYKVRTEIKFHPANPALGSLYSHLVTNRHFLTALAEAGFEYRGQDQAMAYCFIHRENTL